ncbi:BT4734/BF3469 family protein [Parabacteroides distasonis]|uniref:BT4734/BF3469 family protein n=1 Tax=Parabacteroides distasonis TaxID=823 RepID=UPI0018A91294|nr:BT4734/BF3469 family protein [Parabacteroides distasonis]
MKESIMSFYNAPITNQVPNGVVSIDQLYTYVSTNEWLRERTDRTRVALDDEKRFRQLKQSLLPYVTPAGVFSYRKEDRLLFPSGELVIDIDHLASPEEACTWRDTLFADERLRPDLAFISPSNTGVKLFVPYRLSVTATIEWVFDEARRSAWEYLEWRYGLKADTSNADLSRACFLCHDSSAKLRNRGN